VYCTCRCNGSQHTVKPDIGSSRFLPTLQCCWTPPLGGFPSEYAMPFGMEKTRMVWLLATLKNFFGQNPRRWRTDRHTEDTAWRLRPRLHSISRQKQSWQQPHNTTHERETNLSKTRQNVNDGVWIFHQTCHLYNLQINNYMSIMFTNQNRAANQPQHNVNVRKSSTIILFGRNKTRNLAIANRSCISWTHNTLMGIYSNSVTLKSRLTSLKESRSLEIAPFDRFGVSSY